MFKLCPDPPPTRVVRRGSSKGAQVAEVYNGWSFSMAGRFSKTGSSVMAGSSSMAASSQMAESSSMVGTLSLVPPPEVLRPVPIPSPPRCPSLPIFPADLPEDRNMFLLFLSGPKVTKVVAETL